MDICRSIINSDRRNKYDLLLLRQICLIECYLQLNQKIDTVPVQRSQSVIESIQYLIDEYLDHRIESRENMVKQI